MSRWDQLRVPRSYVNRLQDGVDPASRARNALEDGTLPTALDGQRGTSTGLERATAEAYDALDQLAEERLIMEIARRAGLPRTVVTGQAPGWSREWTPADLAWERAWDAWLYQDALKRCPGCGVDPAHVEWDLGHRKVLAPNGPIAIKETHCKLCEKVETTRKDRYGDKGPTPGRHLRLIPRRAGEALIQVLEKAGGWAADRG